MKWDEVGAFKGLPSLLFMFLDWLPKSWSAFVAYEAAPTGIMKYLNCSMNLVEPKMICTHERFL